MGDNRITQLLGLTASLLAGRANYSQVQGNATSSKTQSRSLSNAYFPITGWHASPAFKCNAGCLSLTSCLKYWETRLYFWKSEIRPHVKVAKPKPSKEPLIRSLERNASSLNPTILIKFFLGWMFQFKNLSSLQKTCLAGCKLSLITWTSSKPTCPKILPSFLAKSSFPPLKD